jgi:hypothetical protein
VVYMDNFNVNSFSYEAGVKSIEVQNNLFISNPVTNKLSIVSDYQDETQYIIYNPTGGIIKKGTFVGSVVIDVSTLPASFYLIRFLEGSNSIVKKFIKE